MFPDKLCVSLFLDRVVLNEECHCTIQELTPVVDMIGSNGDQMINTLVVCFVSCMR